MSSQTFIYRHLLLIFSQCKEWGFLLLEMFGPTLGTGDYGHITIEHVSMLFRNHRSLNKLSNQGFEAAHKLQRQLYTKATSHDASNSTSSCKSIVVRHIYKCRPSKLQSFLSPWPVENNINVPGHSVFIWVLFMVFLTLKSVDIYTKINIIYIMFAFLFASFSLIV